MFKYNENATNCNGTSVGPPPFFQAAVQGFAAVIDVLLKHRAEVNKAKDGGFTPLLTAAQFGRLEAAEALLHHGARLFHHFQNFGFPNLGDFRKYYFSKMVRKFS